MVAFPPPLEVLSIGSWAQMKDLGDEDLKRLASGLPLTILQCKGTSTTKKYLGGFKRWKQWAIGHKVSVLPADACHVELYICNIWGNLNIQRLL